MTPRYLTWTFRLAALSALSLALGCSSNGAESDGADETSNASTEEATPLTVVETMTLETTGFIEYIDLSGVTEPIRSATISAEIGGRITSYNLVQGADVKRGETLVRIDAAQAGAQSAQLTAQLDQLDKEIARNERLVERGLSSQQQLDQMRAQRTELYQSRRSVQIGISNSRVRAPFDATVLEESSELGEFAGQGTPIARLGDLSTIKVMVGLPEREISFVKPGDNAEIHIPALKQSFQGTIFRVGLEADRRNRTFPVEIHIDNSDGILRSGMRADVLLQKAVIENAIAVPRDVLRQGAAGFEAVVIHDNRVEVRQVTVGTAHARFIVVHTGLNVGDELVIRGQRDLISGEAVSSANQGSCCAEQISDARTRAGLQPSDAQEVEAP